MSDNRGLLSLQMIVGVLGNPRRYAEDKAITMETLLTRILRDALGGARGECGEGSGRRSTMAVVMCCVSPLAEDEKETRKTLDFASRDEI
jgi:hypothetical protein